MVSCRGSDFADITCNDRTNKQKTIMKNYVTPEIRLGYFCNEDVLNASTEVGAPWNDGWIIND